MPLYYRYAAIDVQNNYEFFRAISGLLKAAQLVVIILNRKTNTHDIGIEKNYRRIRTHDHLITRNAIYRSPGCPKSLNILRTRETFLARLEQERRLASKWFDFSPHLHSSIRNKWRKFSILPFFQFQSNSHLLLRKKKKNRLQSFFFSYPTENNFQNPISRSNAFLKLCAGRESNP